MTINRLTRITMLTAGMLILQACDSGSDATPVPQPPPPPPPPAMVSFDVSISNLTNAQPLSPAAVIAHNSDYAVFEVGVAATVGLEELAEGGSNTALIADADADANSVFATASGAAPVGPAGSETVSISLLESDLAALRLSVATMLVNTNDAITVLNGLDASSMAIGDSVTLNAIAYDAGTEFDSESASDIPGPAGGGEGFNAVRDDEDDRVAMHPGIVSRSDGLVGSDLTEQHRFDNPVMRVRIERTQ